MLSTLMQKFTRTLPPDATRNDDAEMLAQLTADVEKPADLRRQLAAFEEQRDRDDARWDTLDQQHNPRSFLEAKAIAERRPQLQAQITVLQSRIAVAESRRAAFLALDRLLTEIDEATVAETTELFARVLVCDEAERRQRFVAVDGKVRLRSRVAAALASVAPNVRRFRRGGPDPFGNLRQDLLARVQELDRFHAPGRARTPIQWPAGAQELIAALNDGRSA